MNSLLRFSKLPQLELKFHDFFNQFLDCDADGLGRSKGYNGYRW